MGCPVCPVWGPPRRLKNIGLNTYAEDRKGQLKRSLHASVSHAQEHRATLLRRAARARRAMGETSYTRGAGGARESVGSAEARVRPSPRPSSALAARARATGNIGFTIRHNTIRPGKNRTVDDKKHKPGLDLLVPNVLLSALSAGRGTAPHSTLLSPCYAQVPVLAPSA